MVSCFQDWQVSTFYGELPKAAVELDMIQVQKETLQYQPRSMDSEDSTYIELLAALNAGWRIEPPVYARSRWGSAHAGQQMYHFVLKSSQGVTLVSVADGPGVRAFLKEQRFAVNRA